MKRNISQVTAAIDNLAKRGCRLLTQEEKEDFFETTQMKRCYIKGKNKGKERELYNVDGHCFNQIWKLVYPYVLTSCARSVYYNSIELEEAIADVRYYLFYGLQRFGPVFHGKPLSQRLSVIVNMVLTNNEKKLSKRIKTDFVDFYEDKEDCLSVFEDTDSNMRFIDFYLDIPEKLQNTFQDIYNGNVKVEGNVKAEIKAFISTY